MSTTERRLRLVFVGDDQSKGAVQSVTSSIKNLRSAVQAGKQDLREERQAFTDSVGAIKERQRQERALSLEFKQNHSNFFRSVDAMNQVGHTALRLNSIFQSYNILQLRQRDINKEVADSQRRVGEAVRTYGAGSVEARREVEHLNKALEEQKQIQSELPSQYATLGLSALSTARPIGELVKKTSVWIKEARIARQASGAVMGTGALSNFVLGGATGASLLGGRLGRIAPMLGKGGLLGAVAVGGLTAGGLLGRELLKARFGEKEGNERFEGVLGQLGIKGMLEGLSGDNGDQGITKDNSISIGQVNIYTNDVKTAEDLRRSLQAEAMRHQSES
jgi:Sec-independent protein translocase protein TatA